MQPEVILEMSDSDRTNHIDAGSSVMITVCICSVLPWYVYSLVRLLVKWPFQ